MDDTPAHFGPALGAPTDETNVHPTRERANTKSAARSAQRARGPNEALLRTLSEQIDLLRGNGINDDEIAALIDRALGATITADEIAGPHMPLPTLATASWPSILASRAQA